MKLAPLLAMTAPAYAALHHALISSSTTPEIYTVQFDDSVKTLKLLDTHTAPSPLHRLELSVSLLFRSFFITVSLSDTPVA